MSHKKIQVDGIIPPTKFKSIVSNKTYIVPQWIEVGDDFNLETDLIWNKTQYNQPKELAKIKASRGDTFYIISQLNNKIICTCSGFKFRTECKHVQKFKLEQLIKAN